MFLPGIIGALLSTVVVFFNLVPFRIEFNRADLSGTAAEGGGIEKTGGGGGPPAGGGGGGGPGIVID